MRLVLLFAVWLGCYSTAGHTTPRIAIIIDDIGYQKSDLKMVALPYAITYAVLPHTPYGKQAAEQAFKQQNDVMLHMPMEALNHPAKEPGALTQHMSRHDVRQALQLALADIPHVIGVNNHMGSLFTSLDQPMAWTLEYLQQQQLFFVDSLTTAKSTARKHAEHYQVPLLRRHVFLDNEQTEAAIAKQFQQLLRIARQNGSAIAIAHPYPATYQFLQKYLPQLPQEGIELVAVSALLPQTVIVQALDEDKLLPLTLPGDKTSETTQSEPLRPNVKLFLEMLEAKRAKLAAPDTKKQHK